MSKRKEKKFLDEQQATVEAQPQVTEREVGATSEGFVPNEKLQAYYNEAYVGERDRLNAMFGRIDTYPVTMERIVYRDPDLSGYVPVEKYQKKSRLAAFFGVACVIAIAVAAVFAYFAFFK